VTAKEQSAGVRADGLSKSRSRAASDLTRIPAPADNPPDAPWYQLTRDPTTWDPYVAGYEAGYGVGLDHGRQAAEDAMAAAWATLAARIRRMPDWPTIQELAERRAG